MTASFMCFCCWFICCCRDGRHEYGRVSSEDLSNEGDKDEYWCPPLHVAVMYRNYEVAKLAVNATVETAFGNGNKTYYEALAEASTIGEVISR